MGVYTDILNKPTKYSEEKQATPVAAPVQQPVQKAVVKQPPAPTPTNPIQQVGQLAGSALDSGKKAATAGLGFIGNLLTLPSQKTEEILTGGQGYNKQLEAKPELRFRYSDFAGGPTTPINLIAKQLYGAVTGREAPSISNSPYISTGLQAEGQRFAYDPLNLAGGIIGKAASRVPALSTKLAKSVPAIARTAEKVSDFARTNKAIYGPAEFFSPYFRNPEAGKIIEGAQDAIRTRISTLYRTVDEARKGLTNAEMARVGQLLEGGIATGKTNPRLVEIANQFRQVAESVGREAVSTGLLDPKSFEKYKGQYMPHVWKVVTGKGEFAMSDIPKMTGEFFKKRKGAEGYVREFAGPVFKGLGTEMKDIEAAKMYKQLADKFGTEVPKTAEELGRLANKGFSYAEDISKSRGGQVLNNRLLPKEVVEYINRGRKSDSGLLKAYDKGMNLWKAGKTVWNPSYHARNLVSNQILADMQTGKGLPATVVDYITSVLNYKGKGEQKFVKEAVDAGLIKTKKWSDAVGDLLANGFDEPRWKKLIRLPRDIQQFSEETAKLNVFTEMRNQGKTVEEATKLAEEAIFSPYRISAAERSAAGRVIPFYSFTRQSLPFVGKTLVNNPARIAKYPKMEQAVERLSANDRPNERFLPDWMKKTVRTPLKDSRGNQKYLSTQYFYPWGSFVEGEGDLPFGLNFPPIMEEIQAQRTGVDPFTGSEFVRSGQPESDQLRSRIGHVAQTFAPNILSRTLGIPGLTEGKLTSALQGKPDYAGRTRDVGDVLLGEGLGVRLYPYDATKSAKTYSFETRKIAEEFGNEMKRVANDKSISKEERITRLRELNQRYKQRVQGR